MALWGTEGTRDGSFIRPRAIGVHGDEVYVIDTTGRVQVFTTQGEFKRMWNMPSADNGTPTAITFFEGKVIIPDTHASVIRHYTPEGKLLETWGEYGNGEDQFIYPTGITIAADGTQFFSEYGQQAERVHVFDGENQFLRQWGELGEANGKFNRCMAIGLCGGELFVADTANHRVQVFDTAGTWLRCIATAGTAPGQLKYPHDLCIAKDTQILVAEYGANRISRYHLDGRFIRCYGSAGRAPGQFNAPRGVAYSDGVFYVADTDNHRVQVFTLEGVA